MNAVFRSETIVSQFLDAHGLAVRLGVSPDTVLTWARRGLIPRLSLSDRPILFDFAKVKRALKERARLREAARAR